ncbi:ribosome maturation protein [Scheffersomyces xylosifermentans]|uniref:ribosome maturation protein n=1 Tax=Scheffersomyces xylosifermentans TaxID=1304137 RepID=UPI00315C95B4
MSPNSPHKIFYKGSEVDFIVFIEYPELLKKYRQGDTSISLIDLVGVYKVFTNRTGGSDGVFDEASKLELSTEFGTSNKDEIIQKILKEGADKQSASIQNGGARNGSVSGGTN